MAIIEEPLELESGEVAVAERPLGVLTRPQGGNGWRDWLSTVDHKRIGILYGVTAFSFSARRRGVTRPSRRPMRRAPPPSSASLRLRHSCSTDSPIRWWA